MTTQLEVKVGDETLSYTIRGLSDEEIAPWAEFCAGIFSYKPDPPPPAYFERHFHNDPHRDASLVRAAVAPDGAIVASCRVFVRKLSKGDGSQVLAGGVGEVCTHVDHRRRGLSKALLTDALAIMESRQMPVSLLHAAPTFFPVYQSVGYACVPSRWSIIDVHLKLKDEREEVENQRGGSIRLAEFPRDADRLHKLHVQFSESKMAGCIVRSMEYWNEYISKELEGSLFVLADADSDKVMAWASVRQRGPPGQYQLRDFGADTSSGTSLCVGDALARLVHHGISKLVDNDDVPTSCKLSLPSCVLEQIATNDVLNLDNQSPNDDNGWMYKTILPDALCMNDIAGTVESGTSDEKQTNFKPHIIWPADSF